VKKASIKIPKVVISRRKSKKYKQCNDQKKEKNE